MMLLFDFCVFFFKQKTAYDMRISDWSSDVCSSDLGANSAMFMTVGDWSAGNVGTPVWTPGGATTASQRQTSVATYIFGRWNDSGSTATASHGISRSEERRVGKACVSTCSSRWSPDHYNKKINTTR